MKALHNPSDCTIQFGFVREKYKFKFKDSESDKWVTNTSVYQTGSAWTRSSKDVQFPIEISTLEWVIKI